MSTKWGYYCFNQLLIFYIETIVPLSTGLQVFAVTKPRLKTPIIGKAQIYVYLMAYTLMIEHIFQVSIDQKVQFKPVML